MGVILFYDGKRNVSTKFLSGLSIKIDTLFCKREKNTKKQHFPIDILVNASIIRLWFDMDAGRRF